MELSIKRFVSARRSRVGLFLAGGAGLWHGRQLFGARDFLRELKLIEREANLLRPASLQARRRKVANG